MVRHHCDGCGYDWSTYPPSNVPVIHVPRHVLSGGAYCMPLPRAKKATRETIPGGVSNPCGCSHARGKHQSDDGGFPGKCTECDCKQYKTLSSGNWKEEGDID
jgi:hypothetical protein